MSDSSSFTLLKDDTLYLLPKNGIHLFVLGGAHNLDPFLLINGLISKTKSASEEHQVPPSIVYESSNVTRLTCFAISYNQSSNNPEFFRLTASRKLEEDNAHKSANNIHVHPMATLQFTPLVDDRIAMQNASSESVAVSAVDEASQPSADESKNDSSSSIIYAIELLYVFFKKSCACEKLTFFSRYFDFKYVFNLRDPHRIHNYKPNVKLRPMIKNIKDLTISNSNEDNNKESFTLWLENVAPNVLYCTCLTFQILSSSFFSI